ncbi:MAG: nucleotide exchange factor GrpE [Rikenellaceae bacterium]
MADQQAENQEVNTEKENINEAQVNKEEKNSNDNMSESATQEEEKAEKMAEPATDWQDKYLRLSAEFDNYRKRTLKEKMDLIATAGEDVIKSMLGVQDDMDRAITAMQTASDVEAVKEGIVLINNKLIDTLKGKGVVEIESLGEVLDTDLHEAIAIVPMGDEDKKGKIIDVVQKGYKLKEKVIRHAKVVVGE